MVVMEQAQEVERPQAAAAITAVTYAVLVVLGLVMGVVGGFQHSWYLWPVPISAIGCVAVLFAVSWGAGRMMGGKLAALVPAAGWMVTTLVWLGSRPEGDVVIANDLSGYFYLYGGLAALMTAVFLTPSAAGGSWLLTQHSFGPRPAEPHSPMDR
ncbi:DUF6113 family protein [Streptosporangium sp. NPDC000396]|uniref:DUF6113 family protein n=1 Tax=Streptosporangium sp. NPDC000396 TaxID=3366185 RepID=UPI0036A087A5